jgi:hypothetical protein
MKAFYEMNLIIHLGQHKTGSKALQSALYANRQYLAEHGLSYPIDSRTFQRLRPYEMNHHPLFNALRMAIDSNEGSTALRSFQSTLDNIFSLCDPKSKTIILSAEDLFDMHTAHETAFIANRIAAGSSLLSRELKARSCKVRLICYVRRQDHLLAAHYAQIIKGTASYYHSLDEFYQVFDKRLDTDSILQHWEAAFGIKAISVIPYEKLRMPDGVVDSFFSLVLGIDTPSVTVPYPDDLEAFNITPSRDHIEYMRLLNRRQSYGKAVLPREHVLESAFRDRGTPSPGIANWLSPTEQIELLNRYAIGNNHIASRFKLGSRLFDEPAPSISTTWCPYRGLSQYRLLQLDTNARNIANAASMTNHHGDLTTAKKIKPQPFVIWVLPKESDTKPHHEANEFLNEIMGMPDFDATLVRHLDFKLLTQSRKLLAMVVLINSKHANPMQTLVSWLLRLIKVKCITTASNRCDELKTFIRSEPTCRGKPES